MAALLAPAAAATVLAFHSGGYFITSWGPASIVLLLLVGATALVPGASPGGAWGMTALGGWAGLAVVQGLSSRWADDPSAAIAAMNQTLLYAGAFALVLLCVRRPRDLTLLIAACGAACAVVIGYALLSRLLPGTVGGDTQARLSNPISYWNALGALAAFGAALAVGAAALPRVNRAVAAVAGALVPMFLLALMLTYSRGAVVCLIIGLVVLVVLSPARLEALAAIAATVVISAPLLSYANGEPGIAQLTGPVPPHEDAGRRVLLWLLVAMAACAAAAWLIAWGMRRAPGGARRRVGLTTAAVALVAVVAVGAARWPTGGPVSWSQAKIDSFQSFDTSARNDAQSVSDRLADASGSGRWQNWSVAADEFRSQPVVGTGAGDYRFWWEEHRPVDLTVRNAHSLYLEILGENGLIGLLLLLTPLAAVVIAVGIARVKGREPEVAGLLAVAVAAGGVVAVHMAGDWDWQLPALALMPIALGAGALKLAVAPSPSEDEPAARWPVATRPALVVAAIVAVVLVASPTASAGALGDARHAASSGDLQGALTIARRAGRLSPADPAPVRLQANLLTDLGRPAAADAAFARAAARSPRDWVTFADWASALLQRGDVAAARIAAARAHQLNPRELRPRYLLETLRS